jgi:hypothetical protein
VWGAGNEFEVTAAATKYGLQAGKGYTKVLQQADMVSLLSKQVDVAEVMIYNEYAQLLETKDPATGSLYRADDLNVINYNDEGTAMLQDAIFARASWLSQAGNEDIAVRFLKASFEGWIFCRDHQAECVTAHVRDGDLIDVDGVKLRAVYTPGHTNESFSFVLNPDQPQAVFTGDVLLIRGTGRTDFQAGDAAKSYDSIVDKLFKLPDDTLVYPAHDYKGWPVSSIGEEKRHNPRLANTTRAQYIELMNGLVLSNPKLMDIAIPANLACGRLPASDKSKLVART